MIKFRLSTIMASALVALSLQASAQTLVWNLVTDNGTKVPMPEVAYLLAADNELSFAVVKTDNSVIENVSRATFSKELPTAVGEVSAAEFGVLSTAVSDRLSLSGLSAGRVEIYDLRGSLCFACDASADSLSIDVSAFAPGVYILRAGKASVKFIKK